MHENKHTKINTLKTSTFPNHTRKNLLAKTPYKIARSESLHVGRNQKPHQERSQRISSDNRRSTNSLRWNLPNNKRGTVGLVEPRNNHNNPNLRTTSFLNSRLPCLSTLCSKFLFGSDRICLNNCAGTKGTVNSSNAFQGNIENTQEKNPRNFADNIRCNVPNHRRMDNVGQRVPMGVAERNRKVRRPPIMATVHNKPTRANSRSNVTISRQQTQKTLLAVALFGGRGCI